MLVNLSWLWFDRIIRMVVGLFVVAWMARSLGATDFGRLNFGLALVGIFSIFSRLGLDGILVRELVRYPDRKGTLLGSAFLLRCLGGLVLIVTTGFFSMLLRPEDTVLFWLVILLSFGHLARSLDVVELWLRSLVLAKYSVIPQLVGVLLASLARILVLVAGGSLVLLGATYFFEGVLVAGGLLWVYRRMNGQDGWSVTQRDSVALLGESWPLIFSGLFSMLYQQVDQLMIGQMLGNYALGQYSAVVKISVVWYFLPVSVVHSVQKFIVEAKDQSASLYEARMQDVFTVLFALSLLICIPFVMFPAEILHLIYGKQYIESSGVLIVHILSNIIIFVGMARSLWATTEGYVKFIMYANVSASFVNIFLNYYLLPIYGIVGAAYSTLISYAFAYVFSNAIYNKSRPLFFMQLKTLCFLDFSRVIKKYGLIR